jgi:hypothetical protein
VTVSLPRRERDSSSRSLNKRMNKDIFTDKERMFKIWLDERRSRDKSADLMWENLKYFSVLISGLITANAFFHKLTFDNLTLGYASFSLMLPILIILLSFCGKSDLKRRWRRTLESIAYLNKLEDLIGLNEPVTGKINVLKGDDYLFQRYHDSTFREEKDPKTGKVIKTDIKTVNEYRDYWMYKDNMYRAMKRVYYVLGSIGGFLVFVSSLLIIFSIVL